MIEPPPQVSVWNWIWQKWIYGLWRQLKKFNTRNYNTLALAVADAGNITVGDVIVLKERTSGNGGGGRWEAVTYSAPNGYDTVDGDGSTIMFQLQPEEGPIIVTQYGVSPSSTAAFNALALQHILDNIVPDRIYNIGSTPGGPWERVGSVEVFFPDDTSLYTFDTKLTVGPEKNVNFVCDAPASAILQYIGATLEIGIEFQPGSTGKDIGIKNLGIKDTGVAVIGTNGGNITFNETYFYNSPGRALWFVDADDYSDGSAGYGTAGYTGPGFGGVNTVFVTLHKPQFHYCNSGLTIDATTILLLHAFKPRFNGTTNTPMTLDCVGVTIENPEFQGIVNYTTNPYIHFPCTPRDRSAYGLGTIGGCSHIKISDLRFGSESFSITQYGGRAFKPAESSILFGEVAAYGTTYTPNAGTHITIDKFTAEGDNSGGATTLNLIDLNADVRDFTINDGLLLNYKGNIINERAFTSDAIVSTRCQINHVEKQATSTANWFSAGGQGWTRTEERLEITQNDSPAVALAASHTAGSTGSPSVTITSASNDARGTIILTTGTGTVTAGNWFTLTFNREFGVSYPKMILQAANAAAASLSMNTTAQSTTAITVRANAGASSPATSTAYIWEYVIVG